MASKAGDTGVAARYALALFELADEQRKLDQVANDLKSVDALLRESADLRRLIANPVVSRTDSGRAMAALMERIGADDLTRKFIGLVSANRRLFSLPGTIKAYLAQLAKRRGEVTAEVVSARKLSDSQSMALETALRTALGGKVALLMSVDPSLIGGLVVKVGSRMVDSSLKTQLQKMKLAMKGAA